MSGTICIVGVRALHDRHGPGGAADIVRRLSRCGTSTLINHFNRTGWEDVMPDGTILVMRRSSRHIAINVRLAPQVMMSEGMVFIQPGSPFADDLHASASVITAAVGRPATALIAHPLLDDSMTVTEVMVSAITESRIAVTSHSAGIGGVLKALDRGIRP